MSFVSRFQKGKWMDKAKKLISNPQKIMTLLSSLSSSISKTGLNEIKDYLILMRDYLRDVIRGNYKEYNHKKLILVVAAIIYVVTPFDLFPDLIPGGLIDDVSIALWVIKEVGDELDKYKKSKE